MTDEIIVGGKFKFHFEEYKVIRKLGYGNFGVVYQIEDNGISFALKAINFRGDSHFIYSDEYLALQSEVLNYLRFELHENIVQFVTFYKNECNQIFLIMEYIENGTLHSLIKTEKLNLSQILDLASDIINGLHYLQNNNLHHMDLNSKNILVKSYETDYSRKYICKIFDLGFTSFVTDINDPIEDKNLELIMKEIANRNIIDEIGKKESNERKPEELDDVIAFANILIEMIYNSSERQNNGYERDHIGITIPELKKRITTLSSNSLYDSSRLIKLILFCKSYGESYDIKVNSHESNVFEKIKNEIEAIRLSLGTAERKSIEKNFSNLALIYDLRGKSFLELNRPLDAKTSFRRASTYYAEAVKKNPNNYKTLCNAAVVDSEIEEYDKSLRYCDEALRITENDPDIYNVIGEIFWKKGFSLKYCLECFNTAITLDKNNLYGYLNLGRFLRYVDIEKSLFYYEIARKLKSTKNVNEALGRIYIELGNELLAEERIEEALCRSYHQLEFYSILCSKLMEHRMWKLFLRFCKQGLDHHPRDLNLKYLMTVAIKMISVSHWMPIPFVRGSTENFLTVVKYTDLL